AVAVRFAEEGADVAINYFTQREAAQEAKYKVRAACQGVREKGCKDLVVQADVSHEEQIKSMLARVVDDWGRLDVLVNNSVD
ncbi:MAG: SDR family oxidoreductase, partial [bacterium]